MPTGRGKRKRFTSEERSAHLQAFGESGLTQAQYAKTNGFAAITLGKWLKDPHMVTKKKKSKKTGKRAGRTASANGRFTLEELAPTVTTAQRKTTAEIDELKQLVRQQATIIARLI